MGKKYNILIVEDDLLSAMYTKQLLEEADYNIVAITDRGIDAITIAYKNSPDLILSDVILNDEINGIEAAIKIYKNNPNIAIIFLTAHMKRDMIELAKKSNACAYLIKPCIDEELLATINLSLARKEREKSQNSAYIIKLKNDFYFDTKTETLNKNNQQIPLTATKLKLVKILAIHVDTILSHEHISNYIWKEPREISTLRSLVYRTKQSIGEELINNISGVGYSINSK